MKLPPLNWFRQFLSSGIYGYCSGLKRTSSLQYLSSTVGIKTTEGVHFFGDKSVFSRAKIKWLWTRNVHVTIPFQYFKPRIKKQNDDEISEMLVKYAARFEAIIEILGGDKDLAYRLVISDTRFLQCYLKETMREKIELLQHYGFSLKEIVNSHHALFLSKNTLEKRINRMQSHKIYSYSLGHLIRGKASFEELAAVYDQEAKLMEGFTTKEGFLASVLKCTEDDVVKMVQDGHLYLQDHLLTSIVDLVSLYQQYGITLEDIRNDPGFLSIKYANALRRTKILKNYNVTDKNVIRYVMSHTVTMDEAAERHAQLWRQDRDALGEAKSLEELLCRDLQCTPEDVEFMFAIYEKLRISSPYKVKKTIDLLVGKYGMPRKWLVLHPIIFYYSTDRLKYRYKFLTEIGVIDLDSVFQNMCLTKRILLKKFKDFADLYTYKS
ncbi:hypothetical protein ACJMK2_013086 [Sinanodonta woodiana]|uniref:Uncharacterized protein n=1 Tax=Sinanodonta woodiana TaxID=1069815 RepID=A0ABD3VA84_SINWO